LIHRTDLSLTAIAHQCQFSDQSHFIRSFRAYTDMTPGEYKRNKSYVKGHLYKDVR
jgi:AraC family transcriptional regulator